MMPCVFAILFYKASDLESGTGPSPGSPELWLKIKCCTFGTFLISKTKKIISEDEEGEEEKY